MTFFVHLINPTEIQEECPFPPFCILNTFPHSLYHIPYSMFYILYVPSNPFSTSWFIIQSMFTNHFTVFFTSPCVVSIKHHAVVLPWYSYTLLLSLTSTSYTQSPWDLPQLIRVYFPLLSHSLFLTPSFFSPLLSSLARPGPTACATASGTGLW